MSVADREEPSPNAPTSAATPASTEAERAHLRLVTIGRGVDLRRSGPTTALALVFAVVLAGLVIGGIALRLGGVGPRALLDAVTTRAHDGDRRP